MKLTIDNLDGKGALDYSPAVCGGAPVVISRKWNAPTVCTFSLLTSGGLAMPVRGARTVVSDDAGTHLFTGYIQFEAALQYVGAAEDGAAYQGNITAVSDEIILDRQIVPQTSATSGQSVTDALQALTNRVGQIPISIDPLLDQVKVSQFVAQPGLSWSQNVSKLATAAGATYRVIDGLATFSEVGGVVHEFQDSDGSFEPDCLFAALMRAPVNDVTVCGASEPATYVTELFRGDGTTATFQLSAVPFSPAPRAAKPLTDQFDQGSVNALQWAVSDPSSLISVSSKGLIFKGGTGVDGATCVASIDQVELGGQVIAEVAGVQATPGGTGVLCGLYAGGGLLEQCFAGFRIDQVAGASLITPIIMGVNAGAQLPLVIGRSYTMRLRIYSRELQRTLQTYRFLQGSNMAAVGGDQLDSPARMVLEVQEVTNGSNGTVTVLYDGTTESSPANCSFVAINSTSLSGSIQSISVQQVGSVWVASQLPNGTLTTRRMGTVAEGSECNIDRTGRLQFYAGSIPKAGELVTVSYRTAAKSVARSADARSVSQEGVCCWAGSVVSPMPRSSADCQNAAKALLAVAEDRNSAWRGTYSGFNLQRTADVWPGNLLAIAAEAAQIQASVVVREVRLEIGSSSPEVVQYSIQFANDWAESLSIQVSASVPEGTWIPPQPANASGSLADVQGLAIREVDSNSIRVQSGISPPAQGGFEVRRRDWAFRPGNDPDLVLRSPVPNFSIPREGAGERYYVRMYDGSVPPAYSKFSSAIFNNVPV